jgi:RHS repeat-associated protein
MAGKMHSHIRSNANTLITGKRRYYARDHLGSVRDVLDQAGNKLASYDYDPYGKLINPSATPPEFGFAGMQYHAPSGLYLTWFRAYDAQTGRWLSRDPIGENGGVNLYGYVGGDPVGFIDPLGLAPDDIFPTPDATAIDAARYSFGKDRSPQRTRAKDHEYGGWIYARPEGGYSYTWNEGPFRKDSVNLGEQHCKAVASWHTHPYGPAERKDNSDFSLYQEPEQGRWVGDIVNADRVRLPKYLGAPDGNVYRYTPNRQVTGRHDGRRTGTTDPVGRWR